MFHVASNHMTSDAMWPQNHITSNIMQLYQSKRREVEIARKKMPAKN